MEVNKSPEPLPMILVFLVKLWQRYTFPCRAVWEFVFGVNLVSEFNQGDRKFMLEERYRGID